MHFQLTIILIASNLISAAPLSAPRQLDKRGFFDWIGGMTHGNHGYGGASNVVLSNKGGYQGTPTSNLGLASNIVLNSGYSVGGLPGGALNIVGKGLDLGATYHGGAPNTNGYSGASNVVISNKGGYQGTPAINLGLASNIVSTTGSSVGGLPGGILNIVGNGLDLGAIHHGRAPNTNIAGDVQGIVNESLNIGF